ncbi:hypothetical protein HMPREF3036_02030 [Sutterella sp. KLE1602]|nr:hypothetical protein HMPREF3036_02030 [Sutterella sp. KLE1602]
MSRSRYFWRSISNEWDGCANQREQLAAILRDLSRCSVRAGCLQAKEGF